jgi:hypothetical protein
LGHEHLRVDSEAAQTLVNPVGPDGGPVSPVSRGDVHDPHDRLFREEPAAPTDRLRRFGVMAGAGQDGFIDFEASPRRRDGTRRWRAL